MHVHFVNLVYLTNASNFFPLPAELTSFIFILWPVLFTPGHSSQTIFLMTLTALFYYITDSKTLRIFREQYATILSQQTYRQKKFEHDICFHVSQSSFQSWKENIFCIDITLHFILVPKILTHKGASSDFHFLKMRVIIWEKGRKDRQDNYTDSVTQQYIFSKKDAVCLLYYAWSLIIFLTCIKSDSKEIKVRAYSHKFRKSRI